MPRQYRPMPPLWYVQQRLSLSDESPSGLIWNESNARHQKGDVAGYLEHHKRYHVVSLDGEKFHAHRLVYFMRTGEDPKNADVVRPGDQPKDLVPTEMKLEQRKAPKPKTRRNRRKSDWY